VADVPNGLSLTPPQETKKKKKHDSLLAGRLANSRRTTSGAGCKRSDQYLLFIDALCKSHCIMSNNSLIVNSEFVRMWKEKVVI
jgi:hypothetical protein